MYSRKHEFEADAYAAQHASARDLVAALVKLYQDNAATLTPDPLHSAFYDSHPPAIARIARLQQAAHDTSEVDSGWLRRPHRPRRCGIVGFLPPAQAEAFRQKPTRRREKLLDEARCNACHASRIRRDRRRSSPPEHKVDDARTAQDGANIYVDRTGAAVFSRG